MPRWHALPGALPDAGGLRGRRCRGGGRGVGGARLQPPGGEPPPLRGGGRRRARRPVPRPARRPAGPARHRALHGPGGARLRLRARRGRRRHQRRAHPGPHGRVARCGPGGPGPRPTRWCPPGRAGPGTRPCSTSERPCAPSGRPRCDRLPGRGRLCAGPRRADPTPTRRPVRPPSAELRAASRARSGRADRACSTRSGEVNRCRLRTGWPPAGGPTLGRRGRGRARRRVARRRRAGRLVRRRERSCSRSRCRFGPARPARCRRASAGEEVDDQAVDLGRLLELEEVPGAVDAPRAREPSGASTGGGVAGQLDAHAPVVAAVQVEGRLGRGLAQAACSASQRRVERPGARAWPGSTRGPRPGWPGRASASFTRRRRPRRRRSPGDQSAHSRR